MTTRGFALRCLLLALPLIIGACGLGQPTVVDQKIADETLARFPKEILGSPFPTQAFYGDNLADFEGQIDDLARSVGAQPDQVLFIVAGNPSIGRENVTATAYRVLGVDAQEIKKYFLPLLQSPAGSPKPVRHVVIAGKQLDGIGTEHASSGDDSVDATFYRPMIYAKDDTVYLVSGDDKPVEALLSALP